MISLDDDNRIHYWASSLGRCLPALVRARQGVAGAPPPPWLRRVMDQGAAQEDVVLRAAASALGLQFEMLDQQVPIRIDLGNGLLVTGKMDAVDAEARIVIEAKLMGKATFEKLVSGGLAANPAYLWQTSCYRAAASDHRVVLVAMLRNDTALSVQDLGDDAVSLPQIARRVAEVEQLSGGDPPQICSDCWEGCPYNYLAPPKPKGFKRRKA